MILSESEKNRIRALHREASVIKKPLSESTVIKSIAKKVYDNLPENVKQEIEKAKKEKDDKSLFDKAKDGIVDYLKGNQGIIPGDQTELKKNLAQAGEDFLTFFVYSPKDREYLRKSNAPQKSVNEQVEGGSEKVLNEKDDVVLMDEETSLAKNHIRTLQDAINKWDRKTKRTSPHGSLEKLKQLNQLLDKASNFLVNDLGVGA